MKMNLLIYNVASRKYDIICCCVDNFVVGNKNILFHDLQNYGLRNETTCIIIVLYFTFIVTSFGDVLDLFCYFVIIC